MEETLLKHTTSYQIKTKRPYRRRGTSVGRQLPSARSRAHRRRGATYLNHSRGLGTRRRGFRAGGGNARKPYAFIAIGCALLFFVASVIWYANRSVDITFNGETTGVRINSTIEQFIEDNALDETYDAGNLLAVDDSLLERGAGDRYAITLNGEPLALDALSSTHLEGGEELTIDDGADAYEEHDVQATDIAPTITIEGAGPVQFVETWGIPGRSEVWTGHTSGKTQDRGIVQEVQNCVVRRTSVLPSDEDAKYIALTFDEAPSTYTQQVLDILEEKGAKGTFFLSGDAAEENVSAAQAIAASDNEMGSNTMSDVNLTDLDGEDLRTQITAGADAIEAASGTRPALLRAPYGEFSEQNWTEAMDLVSAVISWSVDSGDWLLNGSDDVVDTVVGSVKNGSIVLLTDNEACGEQLVEALPRIIDQLQDEGYKFVTLSELIATDDDLVDMVDLTKVSMPEGAVLPVIPDKNAAAADGASEDTSEE